jgi:molybdenum cofactor guanylyltransferase
MGRDKALVEVEGIPMALRVATALTDAGAEPVGAIGGDEAALSALGLRWWPDHHPDDGPLGGLLTAFVDLGGEAELVAVMATDLPGLTAAAVATLVDEVRGHDAAVARSDRLEPLCAVWHAGRCAPVLTAAFGRGERAVRRAIVHLDLAEVPLSHDVLRNINTPGDLGR